MSLWRGRIWTRLGCAVILAITLSACGTVPASPVEHKSERTPDESGLVQSLHRQIRERDKRIEELESQLNALKVIDQDLEKLRRPSRPPATLMPIQ
jgi:hypothetical protein